MDSANRPRILSVEQAAELLLVRPTTVANWCRLGELPARKLGRKWLLFEHELYDHIEGLPTGRKAAR